MHYIADLHLHSRYSRACSPSLTLENIAYWAQIKGLDLVSTADFTHPAWWQEIENKLEDAGNGLLKLRQSANLESTEAKVMPISWVDIYKTRFILGTEISCIYSQGDKCRRLHVCIYVSAFEKAKKVNEKLATIGNLKADGRPILGLSAKELARIVLEIDEKALIIPAHAWTPWFAVFGSKSGFDSLEECLEELTPSIFAIETGLSSDPMMNWQVLGLDNVCLISNSDAHSPANLAREANVFDLESLNYFEIYDALKNNDRKKFVSTVEFYPEEGMYHFDGHRSCNIYFAPEKFSTHQGICPVCKKPLTIGVASRIHDLANREITQELKNKFRPYKSLVGLDDILAESLNVKSRQSKKVKGAYENLIENVGNELFVLQSADYNLITEISGKVVAEAVRRNREGQVIIRPGYDGVYGEVHLFSEEEKKLNSQQSLF